MVLLVPDDMPLDGANTLQGDVDEMRALYKDWGQPLHRSEHIALC